MDLPNQNLPKIMLLTDVIRRHILESLGLRMPRINCSGSVSGTGENSYLKVCFCHRHSLESLLPHKGDPS